MKTFQPFYIVLLLSVLVNCAFAQEDCEAICNERVQQAIQPIQEEKVRAENWGHEQRAAWEDANNRLIASEEQVQQLRNTVEENERMTGELRTNYDNAVRELEAARGEVNGLKRDLDAAIRSSDDLKQSTTAELESLRTKAEEAKHALGSVQFALDEANEQIKEMESMRFSLNVKGIQEDLKLYWKNIIAWWTGLVMPDKKKDEDL